MQNFAVLFLLVVITGCSIQPKDAINTQSSENQFVISGQKQIIFNHLKGFPNNTQVSIAFVSQGTVQYQGIIRRHDSLQSITNHTRVFEIGSISKVFTATLLSNFVTAGKIKLEEPINPYLPVPLKDSVQITFQQLANHTSGLARLPSNLNLILADPENPFKAYDEAKLLTYLQTELKLNRKPGEGYEYSNLGAGLLAYVLTKISNKSYEELLQENTFIKLAMASSTTERKKIKATLVKGLNKEGKEVPNWDLNVLQGGGAILSSTEDLAKFATAQFNSTDETLIRTQSKTFKVNENLDMGLGWHLLKNKGPDVVIWHNGGTGGYSSSMAINPTAKKAVVILTNISAFHPDNQKVDGLCFELLKSLNTP
jgi:CubicO group peptidase (beta-lactamase class C family)